MQIRVKIHACGRAYSHTFYTKLNTKGSLHMVIFVLKELLLHKRDYDKRYISILSMKQNMVVCQEKKNPKHPKYMTVEITHSFGIRINYKLDQIYISIYKLKDKQQQ